MILRLDPRLPLVWRTPDTIQLGVDAPVVLPADDTTASERMLAALIGGAPESALRVIAEQYGAPPSLVDALLARLGPALLPAGTLPQPLRPKRVALDGSGPVAVLLASLLMAAGVELVSMRDNASAPDAAVVLGSYAVAPARHGAWLRRDVPHLAVVFGDRRARIGPFVEPGAGPCLRCLDLFRTEQDPAWPVLATQLVTKRAPTEETIAASVCLRATVAVLDRLSADDRTLATRSVAVDASGALSEQEHRPHSACGCRALPESAKESEASVSALRRLRTRPSSGEAGAWRA